MCKADEKSTSVAAVSAVGGVGNDSDNKKSGASAVRTHPYLMLSLQSYGQSRPPVSSTMVSCAAVVLFLIGTEQLVRAIFFHYRHAHPIFEDETNRYILSRHIGVDTLSCCIVAMWGYQARRLCSPIWDHLFGRRRSGDDKKEGSAANNTAMSESTYESRLFAYFPESHRIGMYFFAYQIKNMYDTIVWNDGPEYIIHHTLSMSTAWGSLHPGLAQYYGVFFLGVSEISTAVLCILANFDDHHGVNGLGEAFPHLKVAVAAVFVVLFILCRCTLWPIFSYYYIRDQSFAKSHADDSDANRIRYDGVKYWLTLFFFCLSGLSVLQVLWLGQIFIQGKAELEQMGFL